MKTTDSILFIDEDMARFLILWDRLIVTSGVQKQKLGSDIDEKSFVLASGLSTGQINEIRRTAIAVGAIKPDGMVEEVAMKYVDTLIKRRIQQ